MKIAQCLKDAVLADPILVYAALMVVKDLTEQYLSFLKGSEPNTVTKNLLLYILDLWAEVQGCLPKELELTTMLWWLNCA